MAQSADAFTPRQTCLIRHLLGVSRVYPATAQCA